MKIVELRRASRNSSQREDADNLFGWTVFILLLCGFAVFCWIGTFYIFTHPEEPFNYQILAKLHKLDPPKCFELTAAPHGEFLGADKLLQKYGAMTASQLNEESRNLLRSYLRNYDHQAGKIPYLTGKFTVLDSYPLSDSKFFNSGMVVVAQSVDVPAVYVEHVFPASPDHLLAMRRTLITGLGIELRRSYDLSAVVHVEALENGRLLFTCMPLLYGPYGTTQSGSRFQLDPPRSLNVKAGLPLLSSDQLRDAERRFAQYRRATAGSELATASNNTKSQPSLVTWDPTLAPSPSPSMVVAKANPSATATSQPGAKPAPIRNQSPAVSPSPSTAVPPRQAELSTPANQPLQPFLTASPTPSTNERTSIWQIYRPGQMPRGRLLDVEQAVDLADRGVGNETIYLRGDFTVTAARDNRAVLRPHQSLTDRVLNRENARIIVEFPHNRPWAREGESFQRGTERPFQIVDVRKGADGQVNIYVREVTAE